MSNTSRRQVLAFLPAAALAACSTDDINAVLGDVLGGQTGPGGLTQAEAADGIRAALTRGTSEAIAQVGKVNGYYGDSAVRIPLPQALASVQSQLAPLGLAGSLDELQLQINRGAEQAASQATGVFFDSIRSMTIRDALDIVSGSDTAATEYFQRTSTGRLTELFTPIMEDSLRRSGAIQSYERLVNRLSAIPGAPELGDRAKNEVLEDSVEKGLDGLFYYIAREEQAIRRDPSRRTTDILRKVFG